MKFEYQSTNTTEMMGHTEPQPSFFPLDESQQNGIDESRLNWYQPHAEAMEIHSLLGFAGKGDVEIYRLIELPTWQHPYAITVEIDADKMQDGLDEPRLPEPGVGGEAENAARTAWHEWAQVPVGLVSYVVLDGSGGYDSGRISAMGESVLRQHQWAELRRLNDQANLLFERTGDPNLGLDGTRWIVEQLRDGRYHMVDRWSPTFDRETDPRNLAGFLAVAEWLRAEAVPVPFR